jgi:hypothetical protein
MALFGLSGFVLGPAIAALFMAAWELFATMQEQEEKLLNREIAQNAQQPIRSSLQQASPPPSPPPAETRKSDTD